MRIVLAPQARDDLKRAYEYVGNENPGAADRLLGRLIEVIGMLAAEAVQGREVILRDGRRVRTWPVPPYRVYYRKRGDTFEVVRVYHQARLPIERQPS
jgi:toxin ParE1/3/4